MLQQQQAYLLLLFLALTFNVTIYSQAHQFSKNAETFVDEMEEIFKVSADKKAAKEFIDQLKVFWEKREKTIRLYFFNRLLFQMRFLCRSFCI